MVVELRNCNPIRDYYGGRSEGRGGGYLRLEPLPCGALQSSGPYPQRHVVRHIYVGSAFLASFWDADTTQARVSDLIDSVVQQSQRGPQDCNAETRRQEPPPGAEHQRVVVLRPVEHTAPTDNRDIAQAKKFQPGLGQNDKEH